MENRPIIFDDWEQVLWAEVASDRQKPYREAVVKFRYWEHRRKEKLPSFWSARGNEERGDAALLGYR